MQRIGHFSINDLSIFIIFYSFNYISSSSVITFTVTKTSGISKSPNAVFIAIERFSISVNCKEY